MAGQSLGLTFSVAGGSDINKETGSLIKGQLEQLAANLHSSGATTLKFKADLTEVEAAIRAMNLQVGAATAAASAAAGAAAGNSGKNGGGTIKLPAKFVGESGEDIANVLIRLQQQAESITGTPVRVDIDSRRIKGDLEVTGATLKYINEQAGTAVQEFYKIGKNADGVVEAVQTAGRATLGAAKAGNVFNAAFQQKFAIKQLETLRAQAGSLSLDLTKAAQAAGAITNKKSLEKFREEYKLAQEEVKRLNAELKGAVTMSPIKAMEKQMVGMTPTVNSLLTRLEKYKNIPGVAQTEKNLRKILDLKKSFEAKGATNTQKASYFTEMNNLLTQSRAEMKQYKAELDKANAAERESARVKRVSVKAVNDKARATKQEYSALASARSYYTKNADAIKANNTLYTKWLDLEKQLQGGGLKGDDARIAIAKFKQECYEAGIQTKTLGQRVGDLFKRFGTASLVSTAFMLLRRSIRQVYQNVVDLDTAFVQLRIVTGAGNAEMSAFADELADSAMKIGAAISSLAESSTTYARLGYSLKESGTLAELTTMYGRVADVEIADATENITTIVKAFGVPVDQLEGVLDKMVYVGNRFPISASQLGQGLQNAGSALAAAGNSLEQSIALLTAAVTTTQD